MKRYAVIDIGSNSTRLMLAEYDKRIIVHEKRLVTTRIGEQIALTGKLSEEGMRLTLDALRQYKAVAASFEAHELLAFATSAVRESSNKYEFLDLCAQIGINVNVIDGQTEAHIGFFGAVGMQTGKLIDIGGGSTELVYGKDGNIALLGSVPMGCVRARGLFEDTHEGLKALCKAFLGTQTEFTETLHAHVHKEKKGAAHLLSRMKRQPGPLYAVGGTATSLCAMAAGLTRHYDARLVHGRQTTCGEITQLMRTLGALSVDQRIHAYPLLGRRAEIIRYGGALLLCSMHELDAPSIIVSDADNLEGYLLYTCE